MRPITISHLGMVWTLAMLCLAGAAQAQPRRGDSETPRAHPSCPDPVIMADPDGEAFTVFGTGSGIPMFRSSDLKTWTRAGRVFEEDLPAWAAAAVSGSRGIWAPDIAYFNGLYHLYYSVSTFGSQRSVIGLVVNRTLDQNDPAYRWEDQGLVIESHPGRVDFNAIDPALFVAQDGTTTLFWGSFWSGIKATPIDPATGKPTAQPPTITPIASRSGRDSSIEGAFVIEHDGRFYLFTSWGTCCDGVESTYNIRLGRADQVMGPYVDRDGKPLMEGGGTLVLESDARWRGTGHNSVLQTTRGDYLVHASYDAENPRAQRVLSVRPMQWDEEGWPRVGEPLEP